VRDSQTAKGIGVGDGRGRGGEGREEGKKGGGLEPPLSRSSHNFTDV